MAKYLDTGSNGHTNCLGHWMANNVVAGITGFHAQFGYFRQRALDPFGDIIQTAALAGHPVRIVLGSNKGSLGEADLRWVFNLIDGAADANLIVMSFGNAEFHPKTICVRQADGTLVAAVGSANLTVSGLGTNVEAMVTLNSIDDGNDICQAIVDAIDRYRGGGSGVYPVGNVAAIDDLRDAYLINVPQPTTTRPARIAGAAPGVLNPGTRVPLWRPHTRPPAPLRAAPVPGPAGPLPTAAAGLPANHGPLLWEKVLPASDCERQQGNPTGGVRLTKAGFHTPDGRLIDQTTYFRELFDGFDWEMTRTMPFVEETRIRIRLLAPGVDFGVILMAVTHKPTGEAHQGNYTSLLKWGDISSRIRALNLTGRRLRLFGPAPNSTEPYFIEIA